MNILHVISSLADGGAEASLYRLVTADRSNSHQIISLTGDGKYVALLREAGFTVTTLDMRGGVAALRDFYKLLAIARSWPADVIQTWMYHGDFFGGIAGVFAGVPVVWGIRNTVLQAGKSSSSTILISKVCARLSRWVPVRIAVCAHAAARVHEGLGYDSRRMQVIPNGYDVSSFFSEGGVRQRFRSQWGTPVSVPVLGMVARYDPYKDHGNFLKALGLLAQQGVAFQVVLVGKGLDPGNADLADQISALGLNAHVFLLGSRRDIPEVMSAIDIHVLSSSSEAFPNVLAEAMACGTPCVTTDVGDAATIVGDTGWVVPARDPVALASALRLALTNWRSGVDWSARQIRCRTRVSNEFSIDRMVASYTGLWSGVAAVRRARTMKPNKRD